MPASVRLTFPRRMRLAHARQYQAVYAARMKKMAGPLSVHTMPNGLPHPRLGLSVGRAVGSAVVRNRVKRLVREAFRTIQHDVPLLPAAGGAGVSLDAVVGVRKHDELPLEAYIELLRRSLLEAHRDWHKRLGKPARPAP